MFEVTRYYLVCITWRGEDGKRVFADFCIGAKPFPNRGLLAKAVREGHGLSRDHPFAVTSLVEVSKREYEVWQDGSESDLLHPAKNYPREYDLPR